MTIAIRSSCSSFVTAAASAFAFAALACLPQPAGAQFTQQGSKFSATGFIANPQQGHSVSLSGDGNIAYLGAPFDNGNVGSSWIFNRSAGVYTQNIGPALTGTGAGVAEQGSAVGLSADGSTAILGGPTFASAGGGGAWMFTRSGTTWTQQGGTMVGTPATGPNVAQGSAVALSADGNTAISGGPGDNATAGAAWIFTRTGTTWSQQMKLIGTGATGPAQQGISVALSGDGNTAAVGGNQDNGDIGAVWIFTRSGTTWTQQQKLIGSGNTGSALEGISVALSGDGNTVAIGGPGDNAGIGAVWIFTRGGSTWTQQGGKLIPQDNSGASGFGQSVSLSHDGSLALIGGPSDNANAGAAWAFNRTGGVWTQLGAKLVGSGATGAALQGLSVALSTDGTTALVGGSTDNTNIGAAWAYTQPPSSLLAAVLPASRSSTIGSGSTGTVTAFATIINTGTVAATDCGIAPNGSLPAVFAYQTTNPATNTLTGTVNTGSAIAANNGLQSYVFAFTPSAAISPTNVPFFFSCSNATPAPSVVGLNTLLLSASATPTPDVVALAATLKNDGVVHVTNGSPLTGVFAVATSNLGSGDNITVGTNTGAASLPITVTLCQTNPGTGACMQTAGPTVTTTIAANGTPTFGIFVTANGTVPFTPGVNRIFVTFTDSTSNIRGETSVAVATQ